MKPKDQIRHVITQRCFVGQKMLLITKDSQQILLHKPLIAFDINPKKMHMAIYKSVHRKIITSSQNYSSQYLSFK